MPTNHNRVTVRGSERSPHHAARVDGPVPNDERFEVTVRIRRKTALQSPVGGFHTDKLPMNRRYLTREEYASSHGADSTDMAKVEAFARAHNLVVVETSPARRSIFPRGPLPTSQERSGRPLNITNMTGAPTVVGSAR